MKMEDKMRTTNNLNRIAVNTKFSQLLNTDTTQVALGVQEEMLFRMGYNIFGKRSIAIMIK